MPQRPAADLSATRVRLHLKPSQKGTKQLLAQYGDQLVCVRYRYAARRRKRFKTVELLVSERDWPPSTPASAPDRLVAVPIAFGGLALRERVKQSGGTWNPERRVWELRYHRAVMLGLSGRIKPSLGSREAPSI